MFMPEVSPYTHLIRVADLPGRKGTVFLLAPDADARERIARELSISALRKLRFDCRVAPMGRSGWRLEGSLGATVVQPCVITLKPVTTRIDIPITRRYVSEPAKLSSERAAEASDEVEPLNDIIDLGQTMVEALALALPDYPRARGAVFSQAAFTIPGQNSIAGEAAKPFASLAVLRDKPGKDG